VIVSEHIDADHSLFVLALDPEDPERQRALGHAAHCDACQKLLDESAQLLALIDVGLDSAPALDPKLEQRIRDAVRPDTAAISGGWLWLGAMLSALLAFVAWRGGEGHAPHAGVSCFVFEQGFAAASFGLGLLRARRLGAHMTAVPSAAFAMAGALAGQAVLLWRCGAAGAALHILAAHVLGVGCAALLAALWASYANTRRAR
jgi:hypothetical protein